MRKRVKRKKKWKKEVAIPFPVSLGGALVLVLVLGLSYMWIDVRCDALGKQIKHRESTLLAAQKRLVNEQDRWSYLTSPANLRRAIRRWNLDMKMPKESQIVRVRFQRTEQLDTLAYNQKIY